MWADDSGRRHCRNRRVARGLNAGQSRHRDCKSRTTITDFSVAADTIQLTATAFAGLRSGDLPDAALRIVSSFGTGARATADTRLIYVRDSGLLAYGADGSGPGAAVIIARLTPGLALTADDFVVV